MEKNICKKENCTACYACVNICPKQCISMDEFEYPSIDLEKCINCKRCVNTCPALNEINFNTPQRVFAGVSNNNKTRQTSTSAGVSNEIGRKILENGGIVYASAMEKDLDVEFIRCDSIDDLKRIQGSRYVHSRVNNAFKLIKQDLENDLTVLFIGTPCQVGGLYKYLSKDYLKLYTIDLICHGTPEIKTFKDYSKAQLKNAYSSAEYASFRNRKNYELNYFNKNGEIIKTISREKSLYLIHFLDGVIQRDACYNCKYAQLERASDITLGDFWGLDKSLDFYKANPDGINLILANSSKGAELLELAKSNISTIERTIEEAQSTTEQLRKPISEIESAKKFRAIMRTNGVVKALKKCNPKKYILSILRGIIYNNKTIYGLLKKLPVIGSKL